MDYQGQQEQEDDVYGGDLPEEAYMESDFDSSADADAAAAAAAADDKAKELENMKKRLQEIEEQAGALRELQAKVEKEIGGAAPVLVLRALDCGLLLFLLGYGLFNLFQELADKQCKLDLVTDIETGN
ncbi:UNVERIFIED_CONTAM: Polyadenylate-binding protein 2 [Sesamum radiatum]|uniref:Polyadenylate-binding protein 2 n=1 Tax=Sesamum radiatum TaxID=300843 RepID=A0AAW2NC39_SESRA